MSDEKKYRFEIYNGNFVEAGTPLFDAANRALRYGDGIYETIKAVKGKPYFLKEHYSRLRRGLQILNIDPGENFDVDFLQNMISLLLVKNDVHSSRIRLIMHRRTGGFYKPEDNSMEWHLACTGSVSEFYKLNELGLKAGIYKDDFKSQGILSNIKTLNGLLFVHASTVAGMNGFDEMIICNAAGNYIEGISSNLFLVFEDSIITPPLAEGCLAGITRALVINSGNIQGKAVREKAITVGDVNSATGAFFTNAVHGAQWVKQIQNKIFNKSDTAEAVNDYLNRLNVH